MSSIQTVHATTETDREVAVDVLRKTGCTMMQLMQAIDVLEATASRTVKIGISASVTVDLLSIYLRKHGCLQGVKVEPLMGNYDDPIGDIDRFVEAGVDQVVLLSCFDNLMPSFEAQLENLELSVIDAKEAELRQRFRMVFERASTVPVLFFGTLHRMFETADASGQDAVATVLRRFNAALRQEASAFSNVRMLDTEDIAFSVGRQSAFDSRFYFRSKAPYSGVYMDELARRISAGSRGFGQYFYKVLALDCDNTLWGGVIGEDLLTGIKLGPYDYPGNIFWRMQHEFVALERQGVLLVLVTKNNPADVEEVLHNHPDMILREKHIVAKKANWNDKPSNLRALAHELNLGLESFIFLDDSSFECEAVRQQLPMVKIFQVPSALSDYPKIVAEIKTLFLSGGISADSQAKTEQYRQRASAEELKTQFATQEEYLASLQLKVKLTRNAHASIARISELSQKSNQFNLTTRRYSLAEVEGMMLGNTHAVYSLVVSDRFGDAGLTGVVVVHFEEAVAHIESFFMSCRVIGRGVETSIWPFIFADVRKRGCAVLRAKYIPSKKNAQVANFYDTLGFPMKEIGSNGERYYEIAASESIDSSYSWINLIYAE